MQRTLAARAAVKISVNRPGWYRITQPELVAAGLAPRAKARTLRLFVDGVEQAMMVTGEEDGLFGPADAIEFYGTGVDTPYTDTRTYWLVADSRPGLRMRVHPRAGLHAPAITAGSFDFTRPAERAQHLLRGAAQRRGGELVRRDGVATSRRTSCSIAEPRRGRRGQDRDLHSGRHGQRRARITWSPIAVNGTGSRRDALRRRGARRPQFRHPAGHAHRRRQHGDGDRERRRGRCSAWSTSSGSATRTRTAPTPIFCASRRQAPGRSRSAALRAAPSG